MERRPGINYQDPNSDKRHRREDEGALPFMFPELPRDAINDYVDVPLYDLPFGYYDNGMDTELPQNPYSGEIDVKRLDGSNVKLKSERSVEAQRDFSIENEL